MQIARNKAFFDFGGFRLDAQNRLLWREGKPVALTLKEFEVLFFFVENAGNVIEKDDLLDAVWKDTFIEEGTMTQNISRLRKKLEAASGNHELIIETLPKRGYRFLPVVTRIENSPTALVIEEETLQHFRIEETISVDDAQEIQPSMPLALPPAQVKRPRSWLLFALGTALCAAIALAAYQYFFRNSEPKIIMFTKIAPFSGLPGREEMPAFSPDSKQIVFVWNGGEGENFDVYVKLIGAGEPVRLTNTAEDESNPIFSPDNRSIAFVRSFKTHDEVILISAMGGAERKIGEVSSGRASISFAPDGNFLAIVDKNSAENSVGIFLLDWQTGERRQLTSPTEKIVDNTPRFSPDGANVAFLRSFDNVMQELFIIPTNGGAARQMTFDKTIIRSLAWSADGQNIIFVSMRSNNQPNLWQIAAKGADKPQLISTNSKNIRNTAVSPDGRNIAFIDEVEDVNIWQIGQQNTPSRKFIESVTFEHSQQFSPDGKRVVFVSDRTGNGEVWIADASGKNQRQLTTSPTNVGSPRFSPDGKFIVYGSQNDEIFVISVEGGTPRRLISGDGKNNILPTWSADGAFIYFATNRTGELQLWKIASDGNGEAVQITKQGAFESFAAPDGKSIYYSKPNGIGLWRVSLESGEELPVAELSEAAFRRSWTVTKNGIYYIAYSSNPPYKIKFYDFINRQTKELALTDKTPILFSSGLSATDDGKTILYAQTDQNASSILLAELNK